jgi:putative DNA-directed DNA polymerase
MKYTRILIDVANFYYRAFFSSENTVITVEGKQMATGGVLMFIKLLQHIEKEYLEEHGRIYFLFDNPSSAEIRRKDIDPDYKINRKRRNVQFYRGLDYLQLILSNYKDGYRIIQRPESEADDLVFPILKSFKDKNHSVLLVSNDMDWSRSMTANVHWLVHTKNKDIIYDSALFYERYGFTPGYEEVCLYKALKGDESDNIVPGVAAIPEKVVLSIINQVKSMQNMFIRLRDIQVEERWKSLILQNKGRIQINFRLVKAQDLTVRDVRAYTSITSFNKQGLLMYYRILQLDIAKIDPRLCNENIVSIADEGFFNSFDTYPRA